MFLFHEIFMLWKYNKRKACVYVIEQNERHGSSDVTTQTSKMKKLARSIEDPLARVLNSYNFHIFLSFPFVILTLETF